MGELADFALEVAGIVPRAERFAFVPVVLRAQRGGWSAAVQARLVEGCRRTGTITGGARAAGRARESAHRLLARPDAASLARAVDAALADHAARVAPMPALPPRANADALWAKLIRHAQTHPVPDPVTEDADRPPRGRRA